MWVLPPVVWSNTLVMKLEFCANVDQEHEAYIVQDQGHEVPMPEFHHHSSVAKSG